jgi:hypothetical protein
MGIELYWDNDADTVMRCEFDREWTWDELDAALAKIKRITDRADREIAAIIDVRKGVNFPGGTIFSPAAFEQAKKMLRMGEGGKGPVVVLGASPLIKTVYNAVRGLDSDGLSNVSFAATLAEARAILRGHNHFYPPPT